ncbi:ABC transporter ATP-binding protein [Dendrosporobacter sp. 1207_IL3150]|uniref:ABC transporter ATP-binding protein n=1 Tax=Dendrosporobacter sp. 1207_IL3150 TaxID=3084054 RepID=UPI002FDB42C7
MKPLLNVIDLSVSFDTLNGVARAVDEVSFQIFPGEAVAIVGESGCGKSVTANSIMQLLPTPPAKYSSGQIIFEGTDLLKKSEQELEKVRGNAISMIFQDPMTSLNPVLTIGTQIAELLQLHQKLNKQQANTKAVELLQLVGIPLPERRINDYPHQFSGGMRQRAMIAIAIACNPRLLIADEPTTALDVTIQAQILELMKNLQTKFNTSIVFISHDLGAVAELCSRVIVMYAGKIIEVGTAMDIYHNPQHPYTWGLLKSIPRLDLSNKKRLESIGGQPPDLLNLPTGCSFHPRCTHAMQICSQYFPDTTFVSNDHSVSCWLQHPNAPKTVREAVI